MTLLLTRLPLVQTQCGAAASLPDGQFPNGIGPMRAFTAVVEKCSETGLFVGFVPGFPGAHTQGESLDELQGNLQEVITMLLEDGEPEMDAEYVGTQMVTV